MREYPLKLDRYGISRELYNELKWFCRQYPKKVAELGAIEGGFNDYTIDGLPRGSNTSSPTERRALLALSYREDTEAIEQSAIAADASLYQQIIDNVGRGVRYEDMAVPCGARQFYEARRKFFWILAQRLGKLGH